MPVTVLQVGLCPSLADSVQEAKYVLKTLARTAGYATDFSWVNDPHENRRVWDVYCGPRRGTIRARVRIDARPNVRRVQRAEPLGIHEQGGLGFLDFDGERTGFSRDSDGGVHFHSDIVAGCYWLLTGAREGHYRRDRHGSAFLEGSALQKYGLLTRPLVSEYAAFLRAEFGRIGLEAEPLPWTQGKTGAVLFTHDVDYPQIIRWIECLRLTRERGWRALPSIRDVLSGRSHFWKFADWIGFEDRFGVAPTFYFCARQGSLAQYATGTRDPFYDVRAREFRELFDTLRASGCEIGLHASYNAFRSESHLADERRTLEEACGAPVLGNRHHYMRLNPLAPQETLARHEQIGLAYDSSLAFAYYPGFRRGICHPFHVFHPEDRRELGILQIPLAWMDDHFDRCLTINRISDPEETACGLLAAVERTGGIATVDYHVRGMNADFFPKYGPWLARFADRHLDDRLRYLTPGSVARQFAAYERALERCSRDALEREAISLGSDREPPLEARHPLADGAASSASASRKPRADSGRRSPKR